MKIWTESTYESLNRYRLESKSKTTNIQNQYETVDKLAI